MRWYRRPASIQVIRVLAFVAIIAGVRVAVVLVTTLSEGSGWNGHLALMGITCVVLCIGGAVLYSVLNNRFDGRGRRRE